MGDRFKGLYHRLDKKLCYTKGEEIPKTYDVTGFDDPKIKELVNYDELYDKFYEDIELLEGALMIRGLYAGQTHANDFWKREIHLGCGFIFGSLCQIFA